MIKMMAWRRRVAATMRKCLWCRKQFEARTLDDIEVCLCPSCLEIALTGEGREATRENRNQV